MCIRDRLSAVTSAICGAAGRSSRTDTTDRSALPPAGRSIRPMYSRLPLSFCTSNAIRTPSGAAFSAVIRPPSSPDTSTFCGAVVPAGTRYSAGLCGSWSATHRSPAASKLGALSPFGLAPLDVSTGCGIGPAVVRFTGYSPCPSSETTAARFSSYDTAAEETLNGALGADSGPGTGSGRYCWSSLLMSSFIRTSRLSAST